MGFLRLLALSLLSLNAVCGAIEVPLATVQNAAHAIDVAAFLG